MCVSYYISIPESEVSELSIREIFSVYCGEIKYTCAGI